jgi:hypothetical protein
MAGQDAHRGRCTQRARGETPPWWSHVGLGACPVGGVLNAHAFARPWFDASGGGIRRPREGGTSALRRRRRLHGRCLSASSRPICARPQNEQFRGCAAGSADSRVPSLPAKRARKPITTSICVFGCDPPAGASSGRRRRSSCTAKRHHLAGTTRGCAPSSLLAEQFARDVALTRRRWGPILETDPSTIANCPSNTPTSCQRISTLRPDRRA